MIGMRVKTACTSWKHLLSQANGAPSDLEVHSRRVYRYVDLFNELSPAAKQRVLDSYFKFMFVRHPFERLVSAHLDKFIDTKYAYCGVTRFSLSTFHVGFVAYRDNGSAKTLCFRTVRLPRTSIRSFFRKDREYCRCG